MVEDKISLSVHYENYAFLRDFEKIDLAVRYIAGIEVFSFSLPTNGSLLNRWLPEPLIMAGIWKSTVQPLADTAVIDAAVMAEEESTASQPTFIRNLSQPTDNSSSYVSLGLLNEDEALRLILQSTPVSLPTSPLCLSPVRDLSPTPNNLAVSPRSSRSPSPDPMGNIFGVQPNTTSSGVILRGYEEDPGPVNHLHLPGEDTVDRSPSPEPLALHQRIDLSESNKTPSVYEKAQLPETVVEDGPEYKQEPAVGSKTSEGSSLDDPSTPSLEWEEEFKPSHSTPRKELVATCVETQLLVDTRDHEELPEAQEQDSLESNDSSCTCSTEGPRPNCSKCSTRQTTRVSLSEFVEPDPAATDLISLHQQRSKQRRANNIGFRSRPEIALKEFSLQRNLELVSCLDIIPRESGLDTQDWRCIDCTKAIGALFGNGKVCSFTKKYYCEDCHEDDLCIIPPRLVYNWDAKAYPVAKSSLRFISLAKTKPVINLRTFNPRLQEFAPILDSCQRQRKQLGYLRAYIFACSRAADLNLAEELLRLMGGRDHLYTDTNTFSFMDLEELEKGELTTALKNAIKFCLGHVSSCLICAGRGFICEVCQDKRPVYPFNLDSTSQCQDCCTVFHSFCATSLQECPRCERLAARSFNLLVVETKLTREVDQ